MQFVVGIVAAFIGATAVLLSGLLVEGYRRHRDRQSTAAAIAGEIATQIAMVERRRQVEMFKSIQSRLLRGEEVNIPNIVGAGLEGKLDPVAEGHIDRLGLLGSQMTERVVTYYSKLRGIRVDIVNLSRGSFDYDFKVKAGLIGQDLELWAETVELGNMLCADLRRIAEDQWEPHRRYNVAVAACSKPFKRFRLWNQS